MKVVYLAGPYRSDTEFGVHQNIRDAELVALEVWRMGAACICPHKNTAYLGGALPDSVWLKGYLELVRRVDAVLFFDGWENSEGSKQEKLLAEQLKLPIFFNLGSLREWLG